MKNFIYFLLFMYLSSSIITVSIYLIFMLFKEKVRPKWNYNILKINLLYYIMPAVIYFILKVILLNKKAAYSINISYFKAVSRCIDNNIFVKYFLIILWGIGFIVSIIFNVLSYIKFKKIINKYSRPIKSGNIYNEYNNLIKEMKIKNNITLLKNSILQTPMVLGNLKFFLIVPEYMEDEEAIKAILIHELTHIKRKDLLIKKIQLFVKCFFWFNPLIYMLDTLLDDWCEISCDEETVAFLDHDARKDYGNAILNIVKNTSLKKSKFSRALCSEKSYIKTRLSNIMKCKHDENIVKPITILSIVFVLSLILSVLIERSSLFSSKYYVTTNNNVYSKEFNGGVVEFNKDTGDVKVIINGSDVDEEGYKAIINDLLNEGEIK